MSTEKVTVCQAGDLPRYASSLLSQKYASILADQNIATFLFKRNESELLIYPTEESELHKRAVGVLTSARVQLMRLWAMQQEETVEITVQEHTPELADIPRKACKITFWPIESPERSMLVTVRPTRLEESKSHLSRQECGKNPSGVIVADTSGKIRFVDGIARQFFTSPPDLEEDLKSYFSPTDGLGWDAILDADFVTLTRLQLLDEHADSKVLDAKSEYVALVRPVLEKNGPAVRIALRRVEVDQNGEPLSGEVLKPLLERLFKESTDRYLLVNSRGNVTAQQEGFAELVNRDPGELDAEGLQSVIQKEEMADWQSQMTADRSKVAVWPQTEERDGAETSTLLAGKKFEAVQDATLVVGIDIQKEAYTSASELESRDLLRKIFESSPAGIAITRADDGKFIEANDAFCEISGYAREELMGKTTLELELWSSPERRAEFVQLVQEEGRVNEFEMVLHTKHGKKVNMLYSLQEITVNGTACFLSIGRDITARKEAEKALQQAKEHAEEVASFRSGLLSNITHEVRTPLTVILGFTSMLRQGVRSEYSRFVDLIERSGKRLLLTLDSVLDLAQLEAGTLEVNPAPYDIVEVASSTADRLKERVADKQLEVETQIEGYRAFAEVDLDLLERVIDHLVDNAVKFTEEGTIAIRLRTTRSEIEICIEDTGIGIEESFLPHVFDPFKQESSGLERSYQGSGLGLTVSKRLVERFDGRIEVESEKGEGSTFRIVLPRIDVSNQAAA